MSMTYGVIPYLMTVLLVQVAHAQEPPLQGAISAGLSGALRGCETWILDRTSRLDGARPFLASVGLGNQVSQVNSLPDTLKPPVSLRKGNRSFRIDVSDRAGFALTVSDDIQMCHIVGLGFGDFATATRAVLSSADFQKSWSRLGEQDECSTHSVFFQHRKDKRFDLTLSQSTAETDVPRSIHLLVTAVYDPG